MRIAIAIIILMAPISGFAASWSESLEALSTVNTPKACVADGRRSPLICRDPVRAVCRGREFSHRATKASFKKSLINETKASSDGFQKWKSGLDSYRKAKNGVITESFQAEFDQHLGNLEKLNSAVLAEYGLTRKDLERFYQQVNAAVVEAAQGFVALDKTSMKKQLIDELKKTRLLTPADFIHKNPINQDILNCGSDGLEARAVHFQNNPGPGVFLCPGFLMQALKQSEGDIESLSGVIAHEIGHAIDGRSVPVLQSNGEVYRLNHYQTAYQPYWECMKNIVHREGSNFISRSETMDYYSKNLPFIKKTVEKSSDNSEDLNQIIEMVRRHKQAPSSFPADPMSSDALRSELIADSYMGMALEKKIQHLDRSKQEEFMIKNLKLLCIDYKPDGFPKRLEVLDPDHPPQAYRIEQTLMQPSVRALLGCPVLESEKRPCSLKDSE